MKRLGMLIGVTVTVMGGGLLWGQSSEQWLREGLIEDEANQNAEKARAAYLEVVKAYEQERKYAAVALFRLAELERKGGTKEEAVRWFKRIITEFPENEALVRMSRQNLKGLGVVVPEGTRKTGLVLAGDVEQVAEVARLQALKKSSPDLIDGVDEKGWRPIHYAASRGWEKVLDYVLGEGVAVDGETTAEQWTPLHLAAAHGHLAVVKKLLKAGADPNRAAQLRKEQTGMPTPPTTVAGMWQPIHLAVLWRRFEVVKALLEAGCEKESATAVAFANFATPVALAIGTGQERMLEILLDAGADINAKPQEDGWAPVVIALLKAPKLLPLILKHGADPNHLPRAVEKYPDVVPSLIEAGADVKIVDRWGQCLLHYARDAKTAALLLDAGAPLEARSNTGVSPLLGAAMGGNIGVFDLLLERGADPTVKDTKGQGLVEVARHMAIPHIYEKFVYPEALDHEAISLVFHSGVGSSADVQPPHGKQKVTQIAKRRAEFHEPPSVVDLLVEYRSVKRIRILRQAQRGGVKEVFSLSGEQPARQLPEFPKLQWGDLIELVHWQGSGPNQNLIHCHEWWNFMPAREFTLRAGKWEQRIRLDSQRAPYDSGGPNRKPWRSLDLRSHAYHTLLKSLTRYVVKRGDREIVFTDRSFEEGPGFFLQNGDVVEFPVREAITKKSNNRWRGIAIFETAKFRSRSPRHPQSGNSMKLFRFLLDQQLGNSSAKWFNGVDLSQIVVQRSTEEEVIEMKINLVEATKEYYGNPKADMNKWNIDLKSGDLLILSQKDSVYVPGETLPGPDITLVRCLSEVRNGRKPPAIPPIPGVKSTPQPPTRSAPARRRPILPKSP